MITAHQTKAPTFPKPKVLAIDFDGVLHDYKHPVDGRSMGEPMPNAVTMMQKFQRRGFKLVIYTLRAAEFSNQAHVADWLRYYEIPFDEITATKPNAAVYIDDKAYRFTEWNDQLISDVYNILGVEDD